MQLPDKSQAYPRQLAHMKVSLAVKAKNRRHCLVSALLVQQLKVQHAHRHMHIKSHSLYHFPSIIDQAGIRL